jgi:hypothetical protein
MNRILNCVASDFKGLQTAGELKSAILASEGRVIMAQSAVNSSLLFDGISNLEILRAHSADLILLKGFDLDKKFIAGIGNIDNCDSVRKLVGSAIGINLEIKNGELAKSSVEQALSLNPDFIALTAYISPANTTDSVLTAINTVRTVYNGFLQLNFVINQAAGLDKLKVFADKVDMLSIPAVFAVPGINADNLSKITSFFKNSSQTLISAVIGTSQEGSDIDTIKHIALHSKSCGVDVLEFGDASSAGICEPANLLAASMAIRGKRHTFARIAKSINR